MSVSPETGNSFVQQDPGNEAVTHHDADHTFIANFIEPFSTPLHDLDNWTLSGETRHLEERKRLLIEADRAFLAGDYWLAKESLKWTLYNVIHSNDYHAAEIDPEYVDIEADGHTLHLARHKIAEWLLVEAKFRVDATAEREQGDTQVPPLDNQQTATMPAVA